MDNIIKKQNKKKSQKIYFTQETEDAIIAYNNSNDPVERNIIYSKYIHFPLFKLTQNIIHTYKFYNTDVENLEHLQHEIIVFLLSKIHLFDNNKGAKAYSYLGTIVKRWLINYDRKNYKTLINSISIDQPNQHDNENEYSVLGKKEYSIDKNIEFIEKNEISDEDSLSYYMNKYIEYCYLNLNEIFPDEEESKIADVVLSLFSQRHKIHIFNKKALYIHIRERINVKTPKLTKIINNLHKIFKDNYLLYLNEEPFL